MKKIAVAFAGVALVAGLAACIGNVQPTEIDMPEYNSEHQQACYTQAGKFYEYDDDCHDDGRITYREMLARRAASAKANPVRTSGGMKTAGPIRPGMPYRPPTVKAPVNRH
jgi:hypothetical protein